MLEKMDKNTKGFMEAIVVSVSVAVLLSFMLPHAKRMSHSEPQAISSTIAMTALKVIF